METRTIKGVMLREAYIGEELTALYDFDNFEQVSIIAKELNLSEIDSMPTIIYRNNGSDVWHIGEHTFEPFEGGEMRVCENSKEYAIALLLWNYDKISE